MKISSPIALVFAASSLATSLSIYNPLSHSERDTGQDLIHTPVSERSEDSLFGYLEKRRGGGGRSSGGSSSSGSSGSSGGSSGGAAGGARGSGNTGTASSSSSVGPSYGGGRYYGGGSSSAYGAGARSPHGIAPYVLGGAALGIFPGLWLAGAYAYPYSHPYSYHNSTNTTEPQGSNETLPITCLCQQYNACGCDDDGNSTYIDSLLGNGSVASMNSTLIHVGDVNGTKTIILNGTLPNGTDNSTTDSSTSAATRQRILEASGFWVAGAIVAATILI